MTVVNMAQRARLQAKKQQAMAAQKRALIRNPRVQFADWLKRKHPDIFAVAEQDAVDHAQNLRAVMAKQAGVSVTGLGQWNLFSDPIKTTVADKSTWQKFLDGAITAGTTYLSLKAQKDILELNIERAKMGQPPVDSMVAAPVVRTQVEIDPTLARDLASNVGAGINRNMLMLGGLALVAMFLFMRK